MSSFGVKKGVIIVKMSKIFNRAKIVFQDIDVTDHDYLREVLQAKYGICHVPVVEIGNIENGTYQAVTEIGLEHLEKALFEKGEVK